MKWWNISLFALFAALPAMGAATEILAADTIPPISALPADSLPPDTAATVKTKRKHYGSEYYERTLEKRQRRWAKLIPNQFTFQYAGSIGLASLGFGWHYGKRDSWETDVLFGFVPKYNSECAKLTATVKERYVPFHLRVSSRWVIEPLQTGIYFNTISGEDFWRKQPDKYPKNYYGFSSRVRIGIWLGGRLRYDIPSRLRRRAKAVTAFYELGTTDLYVLSSIPNKRVKPGDVLSLALGLKFDIF